MAARREGGKAAAHLGGGGPHYLGVVTSEFAEKICVHHLLIDSKSNKNYLILNKNILEKTVRKITSGSF